ncbi:beta-galactosidase trimerization domain-containing protein [Lactobacillus amylovorus]|uniref:Beta-galactosidase trimerization domain-containing protein n=1 Tax=Lactobacillus amylovorus TaxID=1604 RepID=A0A9X3W6P3_LACAM|nr:beta-galactosidase trimerization domain-containing protein [Lactobacillus amylovorus]MDB6255055.1 beta-galactosidase trimerization domain-containing protein [Lactobacillus amylovorus]MDB6259018.1 beta-galactosidase trimerization domain-containing protein [Lactobacillus amylovorus]
MNVENGGIYQYRSIFTEFYEAITRRGISAEVIQSNEDFNKYDCVLAPFIRYVSDELLEKFRSFVNNGKN